MKKLILSAAKISLAISIFAFNSNAAEWKIVPAESMINFSVKQNSSTITGGFSKFSAKINFDKNNLSTSNVEILVDTTSVSASLSDATSTLPTKDWLDSKSFSTAKFEAKKFTKISDKQFKAEGNLTLKGKTSPLTLDFNFSEYTDKKAIATGKTVIKRDAFMVGAKDAANAHGVQNDVAITFTLTANK